MIFNHSVKSDAELLEKQRTRTEVNAVRFDQIRQLLVRATGLQSLAAEKVKAHVKEEYEEKYGK